ncbi:MAG: hypothetical protein LBK70_03210 [Clostridiales bacterium]|jgi:hypothetical protein|nr:hypothetical protein [Clostridiales bacterium]
MRANLYYFAYYDGMLVGSENGWTIKINFSKQFGISLSNDEDIKDLTSNHMVGTIVNPDGTVVDFAMYIEYYSRYVVDQHREQQRLVFFTNWDTIEDEDGYIHRIPVDDSEYLLDMDFVVVDGDIGNKEVRSTMGKDLVFELHKSYMFGNFPRQIKMKWMPN